MTLLERRRAMMSSKAEPEWDYVLPATDEEKRVHPVQINISAGQTIIFKWENIALFDYTRMLWTLDNGASFVGYGGTNEATKNLAQSGTKRYIVETDGTITLGGRRPYPATLWNTYAFRADFLKVRII